MKKNNFMVIMAGGAGTRFWPMSRSMKPKQFLDILGTGRTLLQQTFDRGVELFYHENVYVVTNESYFDLVKEQLPMLDNSQILLEPSRKNTAPCIAYATCKIHSKYNDAVIFVASSDHLIFNTEKFTKTVKLALKVASSGDVLVTLGIKPNRPDTGYGYIQFNDSEHYQSEKNVFKVKTFTEKPELEMAKFFLQSGDFLWNSGLFIWKASALIEALMVHQPEMYNLFSENNDFYYTNKEKSLIDKAFTVTKNISIDYAIMEKAKNVFVIPSDFGWSDLGTWGSLYEQSPHTNEENVIIGKNVMTYNTSNCLINMPKEKLVVLEGLDDYIVVENDNMLLVCRKSQEQLIRQFVSDVKLEKGEKYT